MAETVVRDIRFLGLADVSLADRLRLAAEKYLSRARPVLGLRAGRTFPFAGMPYRMCSPTDPALLQRVLTDTYDCLDLFGLLGQAGVTAVDVGAHNGETALAWSLFMLEPEIYSFEPDPASYRTARQNVGRLVNALHPVGLSDASGQAPFNTTSGSGGDATFALEDSPPDEYTQVRIARGDDLLAGVWPDLVKVDVEGYERHVLDGLEQTLARCRYLTLETSLMRPKDHRFHEIAATVAKHRFELLGAGRPHGTDPSRPTAIDLHFRRVITEDVAPTRGPSASYARH